MTVITNILKWDHPPLPGFITQKTRQIYTANNDEVVRHEAERFKSYHATFHMIFYMTLKELDHYSTKFKGLVL